MMSFQRRFIGVVVATLLVGTAAAAGPAGIASADDHEEVIAETTWQTWCDSWPWPVPGPVVSYIASAPSEVDHDDTFTVRLAPQDVEIVNPQSSAVGPVTIVRLLDVSTTYRFSMNSVVEGAVLVPDTGSGFTGEATVVIDDGSEPAEVVVSVPEVPAGEPGEEKLYRLPAVDVTLRATGPQGSDVSTRAANYSFATEAAGFPPPAEPAECGSQGLLPGELVESPVLSRTTTSTGPGPDATTTTVDASFFYQPPVRGTQALLRARVDAAEGTVRFSDGDRVLGEAELDAAGVARIFIPLDTGGERTITASFLGSPGYEPSSGNATIDVPDHAYVNLYLTFEPDVVREGDDLQLRVLVEGQSVPDVPSGTVQFTLGAADGPLLAESTLDEEGVATASIQSPSFGAHAIWVHYSGSDDFLPSSTLNIVRVIRAQAEFTDVPADHPFYAEITWADEMGITTGFPDGTFRPEAQVTRQAVAAFLYRLAEETYDSNTACVDAPFPDVPVDSPFCREIDWLQVSNIANGYPDGDFRPQEPVARQAVAAFLYRFAGAPDGADPTCDQAPFDDVPIDHPFCGEIAWGVAEGIINGYDDGTFRPEALVTRQAVAAFLYRTA